MKALQIALLSVALAATAVSARAELIAVDGKPVLRSDSQPKPSRGMTMQAVEAQFGAPAQKRGTVGKPPITRWDYAGFAVYFEFDRVVHAVSAGG
jgi:hypothetical protein